MESYFDPVRVSALAADRGDVDESIVLQSTLNFFIHTPAVLSV